MCVCVCVLSSQTQSSDPQASQQPGLPSAFLAELEAVSDDSCNTMKLSVTREVIEAIFRTYPSVKMRHAQLVPDQIKEEDFWIQFFQSHRFHHDTGSRSKSLLASCLSGEEKGMFFDGFWAGDCNLFSLFSLLSLPLSLPPSLPPFLHKHTQF